MSERKMLENQERALVVFEIARIAFATIDEKFLEMGASTNEAMSAICHYAASCAVGQEISETDFVNGCRAAYQDAQERARSRVASGAPS